MLRNFFKIASVASLLMPAATTIALAVPFSSQPFVGFGSFYGTYAVEGDQYVATPFVGSTSVSTLIAPNVQTSQSGGGVAQASLEQVSTPLFDDFDQLTDFPGLEGDIRLDFTGPGMAEASLTGALRFSIQSDLDQDLLMVIELVADPRAFDALPWDPDEQIVLDVDMGVVQVSPSPDASWVAATQGPLTCVATEDLWDSPCALFNYVYGDSWPFEILLPAGERTDFDLFMNYRLAAMVTGPVAVPEPASWALLLPALAMLGLAGYAGRDGNPIISPPRVAPAAPRGMSDISG